MTIQSRKIEINDGEQRFEGLLAWNDKVAAPRPGILVAHTVRGRTEFEDSKALALAEFGYVALSIDLYGVKTRDNDIDSLRQLMMSLREDRPALQEHLSGWLAALQKQPEVDAEELAAIGYCFGGLCVLDLARSGEQLSGVVSFHGVLDPPGNTAGKQIQAKVMVLHGWDDPLAKPDAVLALAAELTDMGADWQIHAYGNTLHAFTNPAANDKSYGTVYNQRADRRSWTSMQGFLVELFDS